MYYRCRSFKKTPGTPRDRQHQKSIYVNETALLTEINAWVSTLFAPEHRATTVAALTTADSPDDNATQQALEVKLTAALQQRKNLQKVVTTLSKSGGDIEPWMPQISRNAQDIQSLQEESAALADRKPERAPDVEQLLTDLHKAGRRVFAHADPQQLWDLYKALGLQIRYAHETREAEITIHPQQGRQDKQVSTRNKIEDEEDYDLPRIHTHVSLP